MQPHGPPEFWAHAVSSHSANSHAHASWGANDVRYATGGVPPGGDENIWWHGAAPGEAGVEAYTEVWEEGGVRVDGRGDEGEHGLVRPPPSYIGCALWLRPSPSAMGHAAQDRERAQPVRRRVGAARLK